MSNRIIDQTISTGLTGVESVPCTEQQNPAETTPKTRRFTLNMLKAWMLANTPVSLTTIFTVSQFSQTKSVVLTARTSISGICIFESTSGDNMVYPITVKVGTTPGNDDLLPTMDIPLGSSNGERIAVSFFKNSNYTVYITIGAYPIEPPSKYNVAVILETFKNS